MKEVLGVLIMVAATVAVLGGTLNVSADEALCSIAPSKSLLMDVFVQESDVGFVKAGQPAEAFFNFRPNEGYPLKVKSIVPAAEAKERMGNVFRVKATFQSHPPDIRPGMQGIAGINTEKAPLWFILSRRIRIKLNEFLLYF